MDNWLVVDQQQTLLPLYPEVSNRRQNHYQFYGAPVFLIALSRAVNDLPGASNQSTGSMAWREAMEHQFFSLHHHSQNMLCLFLHGAGSWTTRDVHCTILTRISQQRVELCLCTARRLMWVPLWVGTGKRMNPFPPACNFICQYHIHPL